MILEMVLAIALYGLKYLKPSIGKTHTLLLEPHNGLELCRTI